MRQKEPLVMALNLQINFHNPVMCKQVEAIAIFLTHLPPFAYAY